MKTKKTNKDECTCDHEADVHFILSYCRYKPEALAMFIRDTINFQLGTDIGERLRDYLKINKGKEFDQYKTSLHIAKGILKDFKKPKQAKGKKHAV